MPASSAAARPSQMGRTTCSPGDDDALSADEAGLLEADVTVVITTSPVQSNPSLELIDFTMQSFSYAPGLAKCTKLLVCDYYKVYEDSSKSYRSGAAPACTTMPDQHSIPT